MSRKYTKKEKRAPKKTQLSLNLGASYSLSNCKQLNRVRTPRSMMSSETINIEYTKIYTLLEINADSAHMLGSASVMSLFPISSYLVRLVYWLRTWMPLAEILYSSPG